MSETTEGQGTAEAEGATFGAAWGFLYGVPDRDAPVFLPALRGLGASCTKLYLFWSQMEPERGRYDWHAVDAFLDQLHAPDEALIALFSSSPWATRRRALVLPPSPARDPDDYARFVGALVRRCRGRVRYWQNDSEPNNPIFWDGTPEEFTAQLRVFHRAVKQADPEAVVVCGGYDGLFNPPGMPPMPGQEHGLAFFDHVLSQARGAFDLFDLRLYADPYTIPARVQVMRAKMAALGYETPIVCTEYHGPGLFGFPVNYRYGALAGDWSAAITGDHEDRRADGRARAAAGVGALYDAPETLPPQTRMFLQDCPPEDEQALQRLQCEDLVIRNVFALSAGLRRTMYWDLWHANGPRDDLMTLMFGKHRLMDRTGDVFTPREPLAGAFRQMAARLAGVTRVRRLPVPARPGLFLYEASGADRGPVFIVWDKRAESSVDETAPVAFDWPWTGPAAQAVDGLGRPVPARLTAGRLHLSVSSAPLFFGAALG